MEILSDQERLLWLYTLIFNIQTILYGVGAVLSFIGYRIRPRYVIFLGCSLVLSTLSHVLAPLLWTKNINPNYAGTAYSIVAFPVITLLYYHAINKKHGTKYLIVALTYILFGTWNFFFLQRSSINSYTNIVMSIGVIIYSLYYFYWLIHELPAVKLYQLPMFWINSAFIIFFSGNVVLYVFTSYLINEKDNNLMLFWILHNLIGVLEALMFIVGVSIDLKSLNTVKPSKLKS